MGKSMKAMKAPKKITKGILKNPGQGKSPAKGQSSGKEQPKQGILKRPSSSVPTLDLGNGEAMSLEDKMEAFQKKGQGNVQSFLDSLTPGQREALWGRFARAREALKDPQANEAWNSQCKGKGPDEKKKHLLGVFLKNRGDLKKGNHYHKELMSLTETQGKLGLPAQFFFGCCFCLQATQIRRSGCLLQSY